jgi:hypothetical protein
LINYRFLLISEKIIEKKFLFIPIFLNFYLFNFYKKAYCMIIIIYKNMAFKIFNQNYIYLITNSFCLFVFYK